MGRALQHLSCIINDSCPYELLCTCNPGVADTHSVFIFVIQFEGRKSEHALMPANGEWNCESFTCDVLTRPVVLLKRYSLKTR